MISFHFTSTTAAASTVFLPAQLLFCSVKPGESTGESGEKGEGRIVRVLFIIIVLPSHWQSSFMYLIPAQFHSRNWLSPYSWLSFGKQEKIEWVHKAQL